MTKLVLVSLLAWLIACGGGSPSGSGGGGAGGAGPSSGFAWSGTWSAEVSYTSRCNFAGVSMQQRTNSHTASLQLSGSNDSLSGTAQDGYDMLGTGSETGLTLSGSFPLRDHTGKSASASSSTQVTFKVQRQAETAVGTVDGIFDGSTGFRCEVQGGSVTLRR